MHDRMSMIDASVRQMEQVRDAPALPAARRGAVENESPQSGALRDEFQRPLSIASRLVPYPGVPGKFIKMTILTGRYKSYRDNVDEVTVGVLSRT